MYSKQNFLFSIEFTAFSSKVIIFWMPKKEILLLILYESTVHLHSCALLEAILAGVRLHALCTWHKHLLKKFLHLLPVLTLV